VKETDSYSGFVAIVGRPNVGKSTLINALVGEKISIITPKPQTTRHRILGVLNRGPRQAVLIDTPGLQQDTKRAIHRLMTRTVHQAVAEADLVLLVFEAGTLNKRDEHLIRLVGESKVPSLAVVNKIDRIKPRDQLLPYLQRLGETGGFGAIVPVSARSGENLAELERCILEGVPAGPQLFPAGMLTDRDDRFRVVEIIREKLMLRLHQEVPYGISVELEHVSRRGKGWLLHAVVWVEREAHKAIVVGKGGQVMKEVGSAARGEISQLLGGPVHLELWVKVRRSWADSERTLRQMGLDLP
jgi:GTP-binding protein Era